MQSRKFLIEKCLPRQDSVDLDRVASYTKYSPSMSAFLAGFLSSAQNLPGPLYTTSPALANLSPLPFATLHRPQSAAPPTNTSAGLPTPTMISLAFGGALQPCSLLYLMPSPVQPSGLHRPQHSIHQHMPNTG